MFKKLIITGAAAALMLSAAAGAFADFHFYDPGSSITISNNATVTNAVNTSANTGYNVLSVTNGGLNNSGITTGAANAGANLQNQVNFNQFSCGCLLGSGEDPFTLKITNGATSVTNAVNTSANSGYNMLSVSGGSKNYGEYSWFGEGGKGGSSGLWITTGAAAASSVVSNVVNTNVFGTTPQ